MTLRWAPADARLAAAGQRRRGRDWQASAPGGCSGGMSADRDAASPALANLRREIDALDA